MTNFEKWDKEFRSQNLYSFNNNTNALLWLKVRAVCRKKLIDQFLNDNGLTLTTKKIKEQNVELFELLEKRHDANAMLDRYLRCRENELYMLMGINEEKLKSDLYKVDGDKVERKNPICPRCGEGVFMADHGDRFACGKCGYTEMKK